MSLEIARVHVKAKGNDFLLLCSYIYKAVNLKALFLNRKKKFNFSISLKAVVQQQLAKH